MGGNWGGESIMQDETLNKKGREGGRDRHTKLK